MFEAKFYVIKYLDNQNMINEEDYESVSDELYELYNILYSSRYDENYDVPDDLEEIILDFIKSLPDKSILTEEELINKLNGESKHENLFIQPVEYDDN
jgi:hypothetical protein